MKIYFIDKTGKNLKIVSEMEKLGFNNIEVKNTSSFRSTKNDYVVLSEYSQNDSENAMLSKHNNLIIITNNIDKEVIKDIIVHPNVIDIMTRKATDEYIATRITKLIS